MATLLTKATFESIIHELNDAYEANETTVVTLNSYVKAAREIIRVQNHETDTEYDRAQRLETSFRNSELKIETDVPNLLKSTATSLETYYKTQTGEKTRDHWQSYTDAVAYPEHFKALWRESLSEELIWMPNKYTYDGITHNVWDSMTAVTWVLPTALEVYLNPVGGTIAYNVNAAFVLTKGNGVNETVTLAISSGSAHGTTYSLTGVASKYKAVVSCTITTTNGTPSDGDILEVWLK